MALSTMSYRKVERKQFAQSVRKVTPENEYWNAFKPKYNDKMHTNIPFLRFSSLEPFDCAVCSSYEVRIFRSSTFQPYKRMSFKRKPFVADIRRDTKVVAVAGQRGLFRIYNASKTSGMSVMRDLKGHFGDIHDIAFQPTDSTRIASFCHDKTCSYYDIITSAKLNQIRGHSDFVRSGKWLSNQSETCIISGSYDHLCKVWDLRDIQTVNDREESQMCFDHGLPVEACLPIPNTDLIAVAGGPKVSIWSLRKPNKPIAEMEVHRKSVTCLSTNESGSRLLTGCLDNYVRVFTTAVSGDHGFKNTHAFNVQSAVLSLDMCNNEMMIAVGTLSNGVVVRAREGHDKAMDKYLQLEQYENDPIAAYDDDIKEWMTSRNKLRYMTEAQAFGEEKYMKYGSRDWHLRGQKIKKPDDINLDALKPQTQTLQIEDVTPRTMIVRFKSKKRMKAYDIALKTFRYADALDCALQGGDTLTVHSVLEDLWRRDGLFIACGGRDSKRLSPLLEYLIYALPHPHLSQTALHVAAIVIDCYQSIVGLSDEIDHLFKTMTETVNNMVIKYKILLKLQGSVDMILSAQDIANSQPLPTSMIDLADKIKQMIKRTEAKYETAQAK